MIWSRKKVDKCTGPRLANSMPATLCDIDVRPFDLEAFPCILRITLSTRPPILNVPCSSLLLCYGGCDPHGAVEIRLI